MAKKTNLVKQGAKPIIANNDASKQALSGKNEPFLISYPFLWLAIIVLVVYFPSFKSGVTELDDTIFIRDFRDYNEHISNLFTSFHRGLFDAFKDPYYRPLFLDSMILNYWISGHGENIFVYHFFNILFHIASVLLLYKLFIKLSINVTHAIILSAFFAVHPVISQAVAWIPGRNDTILAIFVLLFLNYSIDYYKSNKNSHLLLSILFLLLALFTKETAVFAAPVAFVLMVLYLGTKVFHKRNLIQYLLWVVCLAIWYLARRSATVQSSTFSMQMLGDFVHRIPLIIQYLGKIILPVNLSVFPMQDETTYIYGIIAIILITVTIFYSREKSIKKILASFSVFILFLMPALIVPSNLNQQTFEHRLYLPIIGILLLLPQTFLFSIKTTEGNLLTYSFIVLCLLTGINYGHQGSFSDPYAFWSQAVETSPNSAFANMHKSEYEGNFDKRCELIRKAYRLNNKEKYINFFYAEMLINTNKRDSLMAAEPYLLAEKSISNFHKCEFYLARICVEKGDLSSGIDHLQEFLKVEPETSKEGSEANNNLLVLYLTTKQTNRVIYQAKHMKELGLPVPADIIKQYHI